ncbi:hypothetical protein Baya_15918 [Bagarius yarrelli]|uniref:Uncharacterized protein n=1 Tax=Bagarius yarrelli TaxID=175774 RepID=A0A556VSV0_BAGYA|nr:hypothetical protein Baya_15918 [Bagarius yarrelli]
MHTAHGGRTRRRTRRRTHSAAHTAAHTAAQTGGPCLCVYTRGVEHVDRQKTPKKILEAAKHLALICCLISSPVSISPFPWQHGSDTGRDKCGASACGGSGGDEEKGDVKDQKVMHFSFEVSDDFLLDSTFFRKGWSGTEGYICAGEES